MRPTGRWSGAIGCRLVLPVLLLLFVGCEEDPEGPFAPAPDDDDSSLDDDDSSLDDDDVVDDDDAVSVPPSYLRFVSPENDAVLEGEVMLVLEADGDAPGPVRVTLDGADFVTTLFNQATGQAEIPFDTVLLPDGAYALEAELVQHALDDALDVELLNGELIVTESPPLLLDSESSESWRFVVPEVAVSMQIQVDFTPTNGTQYAFGIVREEGGIYAIGGVPSPAYPTGASSKPPWAGGVPNHPYRTWPTGEFTLWPVADSSHDGDQAVITTIVKRAFQEPTGGVLDLDLYFTPGSGTNAASAPTNTNFQLFVAYLDGILQQAGIAIGVLRYFDVADAAFDVLDTPGEFESLLASGMPGTDRTLDVFFVDDVDLGAAGINILGVAAHRPGPALRHGTLQSGVAVETRRIWNGREALAAHTTAHEIGHFLGLMHTSEVGGQSHDNLVDTAVSCDASDCWATNLMDPLLDPGGPEDAITADQTFVLLRHPLVQLGDGARFAPLPPAVGPIPDDVTPAFCAAP